MDPACQIGTLQGQGGSILVGGIFPWHCLESLVRVPTSLNTIRYVEWPIDHLNPFMLFCNPHALMEFSYKTIAPPTSPGWLLDVLEQGVKCHHTAPKNITELWTALKNIWQAIPVERFQKLVESMPRPAATVIKVRGGPTRY
ncbi:transposable element Tcb2 transposase [Trichonephila clavipes]|nr:transposable element Tcb2 transposase [Trichonephila clavipes]